MAESCKRRELSRNLSYNRGVDLRNQRITYEPIVSTDSIEFSIKHYVDSNTYIATQSWCRYFIDKSPTGLHYYYMYMLSM
jgi:hypothetical protein